MVYVIQSHCNCKRCHKNSRIWYLFWMFTSKYNVNSLMGVRGTVLPSVCDMFDGYKEYVLPCVTCLMDTRDKYFPVCDMFDGYKG